MKKIITVYFSHRGMNYVSGSIVNLKRGMGGSRRWITAAQPDAVVSQGLAIHGAEAPRNESRVAQWAEKCME